MIFLDKNDFQLSVEIKLWLLQFFTATNRSSRVIRSLSFKARLSAKLLILKRIDIKMIFILRQMKLIIKRKVLNLASLWKWGFSELGNGTVIGWKISRHLPSNQSEGNLN